MVARRHLRPLSIFNEQELVSAFEKNGVKPIHVTTVWNHILTYVSNRSDAGTVDLSSIDGLPRGGHDVLQSEFAALTSRVINERTSGDGTTTKLLLQLQDGKQVEAVIMRHDSSAGRYGGQTRGGGPRATLCVSSQVGCKMSCSFCATGTMGLKGNLTAGEIVEQLVHAMRIAPIRNVVFMGMGEPLDNYDAVVQAVRSMCNRSLKLSPNHITISTVGIVPRMRTLATDLPGVNLALSLHAPSQVLRAKIVPTARAYPIDKLLAALDTWQAASGRNVFIEYVMLAGINDSVEVAHELGSLLKERHVFVNLIPYNSTTTAAATGSHATSSATDVRRFQEVLRDSYGLHATIRQEMGRDIAGACGQLVVSEGTKRTSDQMSEPSAICGSLGSSTADIEDLVKAVSTVSTE